MQGLDRRVTQLDDITTVMQCRQIQLVTPELRLGFHQVQLRIMPVKHLTDTVNMVMVTVCQQNICNLHTVLFRERQYLRHIPGRIDNSRPVCCMIVNQINKVFHRTQFQGMDGKWLH